MSHIYNTETISETKLVEKYAQAMSKSQPHYTVLQSFITELHLHIKKEGNNKSNKYITLKTTVCHLVTVRAPTKFRIKNTIKIINIISHKFHWTIHCSQNLSRTH